MRVRFIGGPLHGVNGVIPRGTEIFNCPVPTGTVDEVFNSRPTLETTIGYTRYIKVKATDEKTGLAFVFFMWEGVKPENLSCMVKEWMA